MKILMKMIQVEIREVDDCMIFQSYDIAMPLSCGMTTWLVGGGESGDEGVCGRLFRKSSEIALVEAW